MNTIKLILCAFPLLVAGWKHMNRQQQNPLSTWKGIYELNITTREIFNGMEVGTDYAIRITGDSCTFSGSGIQYAFEHRCFLTQKGDTLLGHFSRNLLGLCSEHASYKPLFKMFKKGSRYYIISKTILEGPKQVYQLRHTP